MHPNLHYNVINSVTVIKISASGSILVCFADLARKSFKYK